MPPDWPEHVQPPGTEGGKASAVTWLPDLVTEYRQVRAVCRHPVIFASIARHLIHGRVEGRVMDTALSGPSPPSTPRRMQWTPCLRLITLKASV